MWLFWRLPCSRILTYAKYAADSLAFEQPQNSLHYMNFICERCRVVWHLLGRENAHIRQVCCAFHSIASSKHLRYMNFYIREM